MTLYVYITHAHMCIHTLRGGDWREREREKDIQTDREEGKMRERGGERDLRIEKSKAKMGH